jgi:hypothetical protein
MLTGVMLQVVQPHLSKMSDRKAELERKKAKLAQIRAEKEARRKEREALDTQTAAKVWPYFFHMADALLQCCGPGIRSLFDPGIRVG